MNGLPRSSFGKLTLGTRVVSAVHDGADGETEGHAELGSGGGGCIVSTRSGLEAGLPGSCRQFLPRAPREGHQFCSSRKLVLQLSARATAHAPTRRRRLPLPHRARCAMHDHRSVPRRLHNLSDPMRSIRRATARALVAQRSRSVVETACWVRAVESYPFSCCPRRWQAACRLTLGHFWRGGVVVCRRARPNVVIHGRNPHPRPSTNFSQAPRIPEFCKWTALLKSN